MKNNGKKAGITVFLALILSLLLSFICTSIQSVRMASSRTQILSGMDIGLYSLFGQYDRKLLEDYNLFALDGSMGGGHLDLAKICDNLESYMKPVLRQNGRKLNLEQSGLTGYRLLTDHNGEVFYQQIVQYMRDTLGSQGVQLLLDRMSERERKTQEADQNASVAESGGAVANYDSAMDQAAQESKNAQSAGNQGGQQNSQNLQNGKVKNPVTIIKRIMKMGVLELVLPPGKGISTKEIDTGTLLSGRELQKGMDMPDGITAENSYTASILFQQYLLEHLGNYTDPSASGLAYQMEYIFGGRDNDMDNLKSVAAKLLFIREGVNFACLIGDTAKRAQVETLAAAIAAGFLVPPAAVVIETALILCWAFAESVLDVRELFAGGRIPLVKTGDQWQISLANLSELMSGLDTFRRNDDSGLSYEDYLQVLILTVPKGKKVLRSMDMVENSIRSQGRPHFCLDSCIVALEAFADVNAENRKDFQVIRQYAYE